MTQALFEKLHQVSPVICRSLAKCAVSGVSRTEVQQIVGQGFSQQADRDVAMIVFDWMKSQRR